MTRTAFTCRLIALSIVAASAARAGAQSLADAARRADEQRKAYGSGPLITDRDLPGRSGFGALVAEFRLTHRVFSQYQSAWKEIMALRALNAGVDAALIRWENGAASPFDLEYGYAQIPDVVAILDRHVLTVHTYWLVNAAFVQAMADSKLPKADRDRLLPASADNIAFVLERDTGLAWLREMEPIKKDLESRRRGASRR